MKTTLSVGAMVMCALMAGATSLASAEAAAQGTDVAVASSDGIRSFNAEDVPTFDIAEDGTVDWPTFSGYRRYQSECHVCHGPDGMGSTYAPALKDSVMRMDYYTFLEIIANGKQDVGAAQTLVMPAFGTNPNVMCYVDDIWTYLRARGSGNLDRGRPAKRADKTEEYAEVEASCME
ncbi:c-type cytochrome, methanol metabolism-related [Cereibacter azotoformans]|uniref:Methanol metabolism-related c-type cytochrome n=2 Tax=Cereibacter TaxID=1653176 RepID=A0A2T5KB58_9RHOB|nr:MULTISPECIES: c-type cytochrome, methanol metabolism-related [Cereibacter]AXQ93856.1 c-type cytochrome, methanol metabolism-related [Cereibacter sphaeroides]MBO4168338.1 c-type cytochrome, methanol metabolism-related [Cereibacter azotoformans]PTR19653.1 methanol metabolism-related c-type cytochrome [Cereibacter azotoformans]UIJ29371.1 c-type cytochrome, methanol metabolism-related [Cereibacter azotoformans]ULB10081.1 c-type cytochrome, methanol metabolism-related [Cereibacter azotoformans]